MNKTDNTQQIFQSLTIILSVAFLYNITGIFSATFLSQNDIVIVSAFIPEGIALAASLIFGSRVLAGIFIGQLLLAQYEWSNELSALIVSIVNTIEAYIGYKLFYYFRLNRELKKVRDLIGLILIITLVLQPFSALVNNYFLSLIDFISSDIVFTQAIKWWTGNIMGQILFTPMLLILYSNRKHLKIKYIALAITLPLIFNYILQVYIEIDNISLLLLITLPISIYIAMRDLSYGIIVSVSLAIGYTYFSHLDIGPFIKDANPLNNILNLNYFILSHVLLVLLIGIIFRDKEEAISQLQSMAHYDYLTGLPNRHLLREKIQHSAIMATDYHQKSAMCYIDLDGFKDVNDTYGHHVGDETLKLVVERVKNLMKQQDTLIRLGGDEFLLIIADIHNDNSLDRKLQELLKSVREPMCIDNYTINISFSIGVSICPEHGTTVKELMTQADNAMYKAKELGKNQIYYA
jgi:diguanylate cyclase (GGDEF)-like protein